MKRVIFPLVAATLSLSSCKKEEKIEITTVRPITTKDEAPKLDATPDERFRNAKPAPFTAPLPEGWIEVPPTQFRAMNYRFGASGKGEVYLSIAGGGPFENANRWLAQFGKDPLTEEAAKNLDQLKMLGSPAMIIETSGRFAGGMGKQPQDGFALAGVIGQSHGNLITIKMLGPEDEVATEKAAMFNWAKVLSDGHNH